MGYSFSGGIDGVSENAAAWSANYNFSDRALYEMMRRYKDAMMREVAPHDGHRRTILDPFATHVGIGLAWDRGEFRLTQEFIRRYVDWVRPLPRSASVGDRERHDDLLAARRAARVPASPSQSCQHDVGRIDPGSARGLQRRASRRFSGQG